MFTLSAGRGARAWQPGVGLAALALVMGCSGGNGGSASAGPVAAAPTPTPAPAPTPAPSPTPAPATLNAADLSPGWNLGNSLEASGTGSTPMTSSQETAWGNPVVNQALLNGVHAAGFRSVRIPVAWNQYADASGTISPFWLTRVAEVVDYARNAGLYVIINVHWDGGWLQPTYAAQAAANGRLTLFWTQIATKFRDYDDHLLFAGTNEVAVTDVYSAPTPENCAVQNGFNQAFVSAVRATGGNNATRYLVVQGYATNIDYTLSCNATLPADTASKRLAMEVHYYDPFNFTLNTGSAIWQWGAIATLPAATETWANESYVDAQFAKLKTAFVDKGAPVILGEYAASLRTEYDASGRYRTYWDEYITRSAAQHGLVPVYWDNGYTANHQSALFDRATGAVAYPDTVGKILNATK